ncbi:MAG: L-histidine N(alpha)-methyltransferase [Candidatus Nitrosopelagicus sp.]|jgi:dimethylhistidine N-methyltransferase|nr:L-histidine N(alpha)-methyltransferase [Candidatus Nitrosopelagicus sp.]
MSTKSVQKDIGYQQITVQENLHYFKSNNIKNQKTFAEEIALSLKHEPRSISPKYFYDNVGSELFDRICKLPEYYPYNCESSILKKIAKNLIPYLTDNVRLVELGSGSSTKTRLLIDALLKNQKHIEYFPIDISDVLIDSAKKLCDDYKTLKVTGIIDTYENGLDFIEHYDDKPNLITFLGSSFGNFNEDDGNNFLKKIHDLMKQSDYFLIGLDMEKDNDVLFKAYNDTKDLTGKFNLNILERINRELDADFKISQFAHKAYYNQSKRRIEMYLRSLSDQTITIPKADVSIRLAENELIHTENSHKFTISRIDSTFEEAGLDIVQMWFDTKKYFGLFLAKKF